MTIIKYNNAKDIIVQFEDGYITNSIYSRFKNKSVRNPYNKSICNIGYLGEGKYKCKINNKITKEYQTWTDMMKRCYSQKVQEKHPTYKGCSVSDKWHNFQNFAKWYDENYYEVEGQKMELDKDILHKGNKIYSPETCIIVPSNINTLFIKNNALRGIYPLGVNYDKDENKYKSECNNTIINKHIIIGRYSTTEEAFNKYKEYKENLIKQMADKYKDKIPKKLYDAMYTYKVEITD